MGHYMQHADNRVLEMSDFCPYVAVDEADTRRLHSTARAFYDGRDSGLRPVYLDSDGYPPVWYKRHWNTSLVERGIDNDL